METMMEKPPGDVRAYLVMRTDMDSLGLGKSRAQAMHAGNQLTWDLVASPLMTGRAPDADVVAWHRQGSGFGTAIALGAGAEVTATTLDDIKAAAVKLDVRAGLVVDDTYPYEVSDEMLRMLPETVHTAPPQRTAGGWRCFRRETTCAWVISDRSAIGMRLLLDGFSLTPDA